MPIDDALEKIEQTEMPKTTAKEKKISNTKTTEITKILSHYPEAISRQISNYNERFDVEVIKEFAEFIVFNENMTAYIKGLPKNKILEIIEKKSPDLKYILTKTDLKEFLEETIEDPFFLYHDKCYEKIHIFDLKNSLKYKDFNQFVRTSQNTTVIPNLEFLSLFIEEGEKLRKYAEFEKNGNLDILMIRTDSHYKNIVIKDFNFFGEQNLKKFVEETNISKLKKMIKEIYEFKNTIISLDDAHKIRKELYNRLQKYNPQLTIKTG